MTHIKESIRINASKDKVWELLADFGGIIKFHPGLRDSYSTSTRKGGVGASRHCDLLPAGSVEERIIEWKDGQEMLVQIFDGKGVPPFDFDSTKAHITVQEKDVDTIVTMDFNYRLKYGLIGAIMNNAMVKPQFQKVLPNLLKGLKYYAENGKKASRKELKQVQISTVAA